MATLAWQDFIEAQKALPGPKSLEQLSAFELLFSDPEVPVSEIAEKIKGPYVQAIIDRKDDPSSLVGREHEAIWRFVTNAVKVMGDHTDRLAALVFEILQISEPYAADAATYDFQLEWSEFSFDFHNPSSTDSERERLSQMFLNNHNFAAKLSTFGNEKLFLGTDASWVITHTLELAPWKFYNFPDIEDKEELFEEDYPEWRDEELDKRGLKSLNYFVPGAAAWFKTNARGIYEREGSMGNETQWEEEKWQWRNSIWTGAKGWSKERFSFWIQRWEWISTVTALERSTRNLAIEAAEIMKQVEKVAADGKGSVTV
ncbi:hypothetical protein BX600DRAFT_477460 [Xylariales sp. PMI_506]|nr:hypothetical protein BX600DRAFT_477460 [Xylariales sp. PMI_506]